MVIDLSFHVAGVTISKDVELPSVPRVGEEISIGLQVATVQRVTWQLDGNAVMVRADLCEWNGLRIVPDKERWELFTRLFPQPEWHWLGNFPRPLEEVFQRLYEIRNSGRNL